MKPMDNTQKIIVATILILAVIAGILLFGTINAAIIGYTGKAETQRVTASGWYLGAGSAPVTITEQNASVLLLQKPTFATCDIRQNITSTKSMSLSWKFGYYSSSFSSEKFYIRSYYKGNVVTTSQITMIDYYPEYVYNLTISDGMLYLSEQHVNLAYPRLPILTVPVPQNGSVDAFGFYLVGMRVNLQIYDLMITQ